MSDVRVEKRWSFLEWGVAIGWGVAFLLFLTAIGVAVTAPMDYYGKREIDLARVMFFVFCSFGIALSAGVLRLLIAIEEGVRLIGALVEDLPEEATRMMPLTERARRVGEEIEFFIQQLRKKGVSQEVQEDLVARHRRVLREKYGLDQVVDRRSV